MCRLIAYILVKQKTQVSQAYMICLWKEITFTLFCYTVPVCLEEDSPHLGIGSPSFFIVWFIPACVLVPEEPIDIYLAATITILNTGGTPR